MSAPTVICRAPDAAAFAAFGTLVRAPEHFGDRAFFSEHLGGDSGTGPVFHVNRVRAIALPFAVEQVERHPRADQVFLPLDVARYLVVVMPSDAEGNPVPAAAQAFVLPGTVGVIYRTGVWHAGAAVLDRPGSFAVLMWRRGDDGDDEFRPIPPLAIEAAARPRAQLALETKK